MAKLVFDPKTQRYYPALKRRDYPAQETISHKKDKVALYPKEDIFQQTCPIRTLKHLSLYIGGKSAAGGSK